MNHEYSLDDCNTKDAGHVSRAVVAALAPVYSESFAAAATELFESTEDLFNGRHPLFQAVDTAYHDLEHTLQVTLCWSRMAASYNDRSGTPFTEEACLSGIAAALFHDTGYLKPKDDEEGTGAKFTAYHEKRSCLVSSDILQSLGWEEERRYFVCRLISATGLRAAIDTIEFKSKEEKTAAQMLATADFIAQMSDPGYPIKLPALFSEFEEADVACGVENEQRLFPDLRTLISQTASFWKDFVLPRLINDYNNVYRYLAYPDSEGKNPYLEQINRNVRSISEGQISTESAYRKTK